MRATLRRLMKKHKAVEILEVLAEIHGDEAAEAKRWNSRIVAPLMLKISEKLWAAAETVHPLALENPLRVDMGKEECD